ncbi:hypothetical protein RQP46_009609 [Phenoliferia psychrophenolica]
MDDFVTSLLQVPTATLSQLAQSPTISLAVSQSLASEVHSPSSSVVVRERLHQVIDALSHLPSTLSFLQLSLYAAAFEPQNATAVRETVGRALETDSLLFKQVSLLGPQNLVQALESIGGGSKGGGGQEEAEAERRVRVGLALARSTPKLGAAYGNSKAVLTALSIAYSRLQAADRAGATSPTTAALALRVLLLETTSILLHSAFLDPLASSSLSPSARSEIWDALIHALRPSLDALPPFPKAKGSPLIDRTLLGDLQQFFQIGDKMLASAGMATERRDVAEQIRKLEVREVDDDAIALLRTVASDADVPVINKGKGKAVQDSVQTNADTSLTLALSQILDVLPDLSPAFLTVCLRHPVFANDPERVVAALLEDDLPNDLRQLRDGPAEAVSRSPSPEPYIPPPTVTRSNIFDDDQLDAAKLRRGKSTATADLLLSDHTFLTDELKAAIIERAERESSDEESSDGDGFPEDATEDKGFKVRDGEDGEDDAADSKDDPAAPSRDPLANPITPAVAKLLELAYIADPSVFDRTSVVKRGKPRADLRERTGLADEQLEGWRAMLERNPKKDKILARHEFAGNRRAADEEGDGSADGPVPGQAAVWKIIPFFKSTSIEATVAYYTTHLDFTLGGTHSHSSEAPRSDGASPPLTFASLFMGPKAEANIYFSTDPSQPVGRAMIALRPLAALDKLYGDITSEGKADVVKTVQDMAWGYRQFAIRDLDGNTVVFFAFLEGDVESSSAGGDAA